MSFFQKAFPPHHRIASLIGMLFALPFVAIIAASPAKLCP